MKYFSKKLNNSLIIIFSLLSITLQTKAATPLADQPMFASKNVPANVALALSVEWPTALSDAYPPADFNYKVTDPYLGYFDADKCYDYDVAKHYFVPVLKLKEPTHDCAGKYWSGNFLNWALTQTIDPLRQALTGGYRSIDTKDLTVLEKAYASTTQGTKVVIKSIEGDHVSKATPYKWSNFNLRITRQGNSFVFTNKGDLAPILLTDDLPEVPSKDGKDSKEEVYRMYARVQVCASHALKETNCTVYPSGSIKPEGLIHKHATKLNLAAFGYLYDSNPKRDGGVLRARMAPLGPTMAVPGSQDVKNPKPEWDANTGIFIQNPNPTDATTTGVNNSGVINYLNKFGLNAQGYKSADNVSELYYTAIRYFKNQGNVASYSNELTSEMADGFPVITKWDDPIKYACQANYIIGVGDSNTWADGNLPGSTMHSSNERTPPPEVSADKTVDVTTLTNKIGELEGLKKNNLGEMFIPWTMDQGETLTGGTFYLAGLAYDSHTKDIRPDLEDSQSVSTYWLDVLEKKGNANPDRHNFGGINGMRNQFWLAAKYGGFTVPKGFDPNTTTPLKSDLWDISGRKDKNGIDIEDDDPDHYFRANNPALMTENLSKAFNSILSNPVSGSSGSFNLKSLSVTAGDLSYGASYSSTGWTGDVTASPISLTNLAENSPLWHAGKILESQDWNNGRFIATSNCTDPSSGTPVCTGVPFRFSEKLSSANKANLKGSNQESLLNFLRGDRSNEASTTNKTGYRIRAKKLGDIVNSDLFVNGAPHALYSDLFNPGYSKFKETNAKRQTVLYVGANDGMLHAFNGAASGGGNELFAYVPQALFAGPNKTPEVDGLTALSNPDYIHHYYVDASPVVVDVNFGGGAGDWHSLLVGGLGKGGKSYFAIDVTHPETLSNEGKLADAIKWEFTDPRMGYTYGKPVIVKTKKYGWVVILTSGYNNGGQAYFFILKASTGELLKEIAVGNASETFNSGLASASAYINDYRDYTADSVYAGDLFGYVWRLDLTSPEGDYPEPTKLAYLTSPSGGPQPITVAPRIEVDRGTSKRFVFVGTGKLLDNSDVKDTQGQTFYAIHDGTSATFFKPETAPTTFPFKRENMEPNKDLIAGVPINLGKKTGWYIDLGWGGDGVGYRVNKDLTSGAGIVAFVANLTAGDACNPSGSHDTYALFYGTGKSAIINSNGNVVEKIHVSTGLGNTPALIDLPDGSQKLVDICDNCENGGSGVNTGKSTGFKILNWRGIPNGN